MTDEERILPSNPRVIIAGIRQFGLAADGSDLRDLEAAIDRLSTPPSVIREKDREIETERARTEWWRIQMKEQVGDANDRTKAAEAQLAKAVNVLKEASDILGNEDMPDQIRLECAGWIDSILSEIETKEAAE